MRYVRTNNGCNLLRHVPSPQNPSRCTNDKYIKHSHTCPLNQIDILHVHLANLARQFWRSENGKAKAYWTYWPLSQRVGHIAKHLQRILTRLPAHGHPDLTYRTCSRHRTTRSQPSRTAPRRQPRLPLKSTPCRTLQPMQILLQSHQTLMSTS